MSLSRRDWMAASGALGLAAIARSAGAASGRATEARWLGAWGTALTPAGDGETVAAGTRLGCSLVSSLAGRAVRLRLSNDYGAISLAIDGVEIRSAGTTARAWFGRHAGIDIPPGASVVTDAIPLPVVAGQKLDVSLVLPKGGRISAVQRSADGKGGWIEDGKGRRDALPALVSTLDVAGGSVRPVVAILSDTKSAGPGTWPESLAVATAGRLGIVNRSVYGGHLALGPAQASALARFDRDVAATSGLSHVVIFAGNNDLIQPGMIGSSGRPALDPAQMLTGEQLITLLGQAALRARAAGAKAIGATWLPYEGVTIAQGYSTPEKLAIRDQLNAWVRSSDAFDAVIDFDAALRDPARPARLAADYDSGNHFTPNAAGYARMSEVAAKLLV